MQGFLGMGNGITQTNNHIINANSGQLVASKNQTYCTCNIGEWICKDFYCQHMVEVMKQFAEDNN